MINEDKPAQPVAGESPLDEQAAFFQHYGIKNTIGFDDADCYGNEWDGWQARAAIARRAAQPVQQPAAVVGQEPVATVVSRAGDDLRIGWLRPENVAVGSLLYTAPVPSAGVQPIIECTVCGGQGVRHDTDGEYIEKCTVCKGTGIAAGVQGDIVIGFPDPEAAFAMFCDREGFPSDGDMDEALRKAFYEGTKLGHPAPSILPDSRRDAALSEDAAWLEWSSNWDGEYADPKDLFCFGYQFALAAHPANGAQAGLSDEHRAVIAEAAQVLESAAAHNRSKSRTVLAHTQQERADRLREVFLAAAPQKKEG